MLEKRAPGIWFLIIFEIGGGIIGAVATLIYLPQALDIHSSYPEVISFSILAITLYIIVAMSGILLLLRRRGGVYLSIVSQLIQVPVFTIGAVSYQFVAGLGLIMFTDNTGFFLSLASGSDWNAAVSGTEPFKFGLNLIAVSFCIYLFEIVGRFRRQQASLSPTGSDSYPPWERRGREKGGREHL
jgi:signal transduction histidine kinase